MDRDTLISHFEALGFAPVDNSLYSQLGVTPDLVVEKDSTIKAIVIRESPDSLPDSMIQRLSQSKRIPSKILELYFAFPSKPSMRILGDCKKNLVGILYPDSHSAVQTYAEPKQIKGRKVIKAIPKTQVFFCSRQDLKERSVGEELIKYQYESLKVPLFPMLIENYAQLSSDITRLKEVICNRMDECDYVTIILSGERREMIEFETRRALEYYEPGEILFYVKNDKQTKEAWADILLHATNQGIWYKEYFDEKDFSFKYNPRLLQIIKKLHEKHNVPFLADD